VESFDGRQADWDGHLVLVHDNERQRRTGVAAWVRRGLDLGAKIIYIEPSDVPVHDSLKDVLKEHAVDVGGAFESGQLEVFAATPDVYEPAWQSKVVEAALAAGYPSVRWSGAAATAWSVMSPSAHVDIEWATDRLCQEQPVSILCQYAADLPQPTLQIVCALHGAGMREAQLRTSPVPDGGVALSGSVDASNQRLLRSALIAASSSTADRSVFVIDLSELDFLDVAGARAFLTGTTGHRIRRGAVCLRAPQRPVESVLRLLRVDVADGFEIEGD
jgi:anti-anti-sigma factor